MSNSTDLFNLIQKDIDKALLEDKPIDDYVKKQIEILKEAHDEFVSTAEKQGFDLRSVKVGEIEIQQYSAMKQLAQKIGLSVDEYDEQIKNVRIRILGEENYKNFFENN